GLLRVDLVHVDGAWSLERGKDSALGDLVEGQPEDPAVRAVPQRLGQMPGDGLPFPVGIGGEIDRRGLTRALLQLFQDLRLPLDQDVGRLEAVLDVDPELALREIAHVPVRGAHLETGAEVFADGPGLRGRFYDDEASPPLRGPCFRRRLRGLRGRRRLPGARGMISSNCSGVTRPDSLRRKKYV